MTLTDEIVTRSIIKCVDTTTNHEFNQNNTQINVKKVQSNGFKDPIWRVCCGERVFTKCSKVMVTHSCFSCQRINTITLKLFLRKLIRNIVQCRTCCNLDETKRVNHSQWMQGDKIKKEKTTIKLTPKQLIQESMDEFESQDDDFKQTYFRKFLTNEEFDRLKSKIVSFHHNKITNVEDYQYIPVLKVNNQYRFYPTFYHPHRDCFEKASYIRFTCDNCRTCFENKTLEVQKNKFKILCRECSFTNNTFKIRFMQNSQGERICFQSKFELKFIQFCNEHKIVLQNGPKIQYVWNGSSHMYKCDFYIPSNRLLVEIKDNHCWHKQQLASGKWEAKAAAANKLVENNPGKYTKYIVVYPGSYMEFTKGLVKYETAKI